VTDLGQTLWQLVLILVQLLGELISLGLHWALLIAWVAWWLCGVNWKKAWPVLAQGAWAPVVLLALVAGLVWSRLVASPGAWPGTWLGLAPLPNFWWQLGNVALLVGLAFFCGWLQGVFGWEPSEISLEPPTTHAAHHHEHP
jgi:hypothetical protein